MTKPALGLTGEQHSALVEILRRTLADEYLLYTKTRNYHWNVTGPHFHDLHALFEKQYTLLEASIDQVAENIRYFGHAAPGTLTEFSALTRLTEQPGVRLAAREMVESLLASHETFIRHTRADIAAAGSLNAPEIEDFLTGLLEQHLKMAWMLRAMIE